MAKAEQRNAVAARIIRAEFVWEGGKPFWWSLSLSLSWTAGDKTRWACTLLGSHLFQAELTAIFR